MTPAGEAEILTHALKSIIDAHNGGSFRALDQAINNAECRLKQIEIAQAHAKPRGPHHQRFLRVQKGDNVA